MATHDLRLEVTVFGSVFSIRVSVEGEGVDLHVKDGKLVAELPDFPVEGPLNVSMRAKGINGARTTLTVSSDGVTLSPKLVAVIAGGVGERSHAYAL